MAYTKQTWADLPSKTTPINAERLTHIEDGIFNAAQTADTAASTAGTAAANIGIVSGRVETLTGRVNGLDTAVSNKVDKVTGKGLSTNDYDDTDKGKVDSLGTASTKNSTSVVTDSTDLVESGAVYSALQGKTDNTVITNNFETGNYSRAYSVGEHFMNNGVFRTVKATVASGDEITDNNSFVDTVGDYLNKPKELVSGVNLKAENDSANLSENVKKYRILLIVIGRNNISDGQVSIVLPSYLSANYCVGYIRYEGVFYDITFKIDNDTTIKVYRSTIPSNGFGIRTVLGIK